MTTCLSDLCLDERMAGELADAEARAADDHLAGCARCQRRHDQLAAGRARFRAALPALRRRRTAWPAATAIGGALAVAATVVLVVRPPATGTRTKGGARLGLVIARGDAMQIAGAGDRVHPGDTVSFLVTSARPTYVAVLSRDGAGRPSVYFPSGPRAERVAAGRDVQLPRATVLDDTLGREQLYAVFCEAPVAVAALQGALAAGTLERALPEGCVVDVVAIEKVQ